MSEPMTPEERAESLTWDPQVTLRRDLNKLIAAAITDAVAEEREACAEVAEAWYESFALMQPDLLQRRIAAAIRRRPPASPPSGQGPVA